MIFQRVDSLKVVSLGQGLQLGARFDADLEDGQGILERHLAACRLLLASQPRALCFFKIGEPKLGHT